MTRQDVFDWVRKEYGTEPEYPWFDQNAVLRRKNNDKWYGVILEFAGAKFRSDGTEAKEIADRQKNRAAG